MNRLQKANAVFAFLNVLNGQNIIPRGPDGKLVDTILPTPKASIFSNLTVMSVISIRIRTTGFKSGLDVRTKIDIELFSRDL